MTHALAAVRDRVCEVAAVQSRIPRRARNAQAPMIAAIRPTLPNQTPAASVTPLARETKASATGSSDMNHEETHPVDTSGTEQ
jgi:hypothetical protein